MTDRVLAVHDTESAGFARKRRETAVQPGTEGADYTERLQRIGGARWKRMLGSQAPYRWNIRRLNLGRTLDVGCGIGRGGGVPRACASGDSFPEACGCLRTTTDRSGRTSLQQAFGSTRPVHGPRSLHRDKW